MRGRLRNPNHILEEVPESERMQGGDEDVEEVIEDGLPFTKRMRVETRKIHNISDTLVNAKLGLAMSDDKIWAEGLLIFYEIFKFLEAAMIRLSLKNEPFRRMSKVIEGVERTKAFESDLNFYYGEGYLKDYQVRDSVLEYLKHLKTLEEREPLRLLAYIYHLYMGLLSGGQILQRRRELTEKLLPKLKLFQLLGLQSVSAGSKQGAAVTFFGDGRSISDIKKDIAFTMNDIAEDLSNDEKNSLLDESRQVFKRNNEIVSSISGTGFTALKNYAACILLFLAIGSAIYLFSTT